ncbi:hypothetical protein HD554DRAFT_2039274 [Boletus coccyginus]|nr:hypothetical protein HD554DRAFT_2039274 [Boletus coccyginus]
MAIISKSRWSVALPDELERMIFLLASREPHELAKYLLVARRVKRWLQPILYRKISIYCDVTAKDLIQSLTIRPKRILYLFVGVSVHPSTTAKLLRLCPRLMNLVLRAGGNILSKYRVVIDAVNSLPHLKFLSIDPAVVFQTRFVHLPDASMFHRISHLDLTTRWSWEAVVRGFQYLCCLTHLAITWKQSRYATDALRDLLRRPDFAMLVLWRDELATYPLVINSLVRRKLDDPRIVVLQRASCWYSRVDGGHWLHAARIIARRKENKRKAGGSEEALRYGYKEIRGSEEDAGKETTYRVQLTKRWRQGDRVGERWWQRKGNASMDLQPHCRSMRDGDGAIQWTQSPKAVSARHKVCRREWLSGTKPTRILGALRGVLGGKGSASLAEDLDGGVTGVVGPREDDSRFLVKANPKFPPGDTPTIDFPSSPPTADAPVVHVDPRTVHPLQQSKHRYHPYTSPTKASIRDLRIASRSLGLSARSDITLEDLQRGKAYFLSALSDIPHCVLENAYESKLADRECYTYRVALSMAEIKSSKRRQDLLESIRECHKRDAAANEEQIVILEGLLGMKHVTVDDMMGDEQSQRANQEDSLAELGAVDEEVSYLKEAIQGRGWMHALSNRDGESSDSDNGDIPIDNPCRFNILICHANEATQNNYPVPDEQYIELPLESRPYQAHRFAPYSLPHQLSHSQAAIEHGQQVFERMWPAIRRSHSPSPHLTATVQPVHPNVDINPFGDPGSNIIAVGCTQRHQMWADLPQIPPPPPPPPAPAPAPPPAFMSSMPALVPPEVPAPVGPTPNNPTVPAPTPVPAPVLPPTSVPIPQTVIAGAEDDEKRSIIAQARREIVRLMAAECAVPNKADRKGMIERTIASAIRSATGGTDARPPKGIEREMRETMCEVRRVFKTYALYHLHREFSLRPAQGQPVNAYRASRVRELLRSYEFLRERPSVFLFSSPFFENFILDALTLFPFQLGSFIGPTKFDNIFCLAGAAIIAALHDFDEGPYKPRSLDGETWRGYYKEIMLKVKEVRADLTTGLWLQDFQSRMLARTQGT